MSLIIIIIPAKCPNTVWVLHREKAVLGVVLSCYVVLGSRVVLCFVYLKSIGNPRFWRPYVAIPKFGGEVGSVAITGFGGLGWVWEAVCIDSWVGGGFGKWVWEKVWGGLVGGFWRPYVAIAGCGEGLGVWEEVWEAVCSDSWVWRRWSGRWVWGDRM